LRRAPAEQPGEIGEAVVRGIAAAVNERVDGA
jgi:hypothetical protein